MPTAKKINGGRKFATSKQGGVGPRTIASKKLTESPTARKKVKKVMHEYKEGTLRTGSKHGPKVRSRKQAIAIALSEAGASNKKKTTKKESKK